QMRGGVPGEHPDREPGDRAVEGKNGSLGPRHGETFECTARGRGGARLCRSERAGSQSAWTQGAPRSEARTALALPWQDQFAKDVAETQNAGERRGGAVSWARGCPVKFAYYPGCSARSTCAELNEATHRVAASLGLDLVQLDTATCTGARELRA